MKKILIIIFLFPLIAFSQVSGWRGGGSHNYSGGGFRGTAPSAPIYRPIQDPNISNWRSNPPKYKYYQNPNNSGSIYRQPYNHHHYDDWYYGGYNRWNIWGAPMYGYNWWLPGYYYDTWGYREPYRVYEYQDGRMDTIKGKATHFSFGLQGSTLSQVGGWFTIGNRGYFIAEYNYSIKKDNNTYFPYGTLDQVDFPLVGDWKKTNTFYMGGGKKFGRTGVHLMLGSAHEVVRYRGYDSMGYITFPKNTRDFVTAKIGVIRDFKNLTLKFDADPIVGSVYFGAGFNF
jgi:hypothetical protein